MHTEFSLFKHNYALCIYLLYIIEFPLLCMFLDFLVCREWLLQMQCHEGGEGGGGGAIGRDI